jgi:UDP:flavonoid glycosyltransferase YjiC (YdhE family)
MRVLLSCAPFWGHAFPLIPLARAFRDRGDDVAVLSGANLAGLLADEEGIELLAVGPEVEALFADVDLKLGLNPAATPTLASVAELFAGARLDLTADEALPIAREFGPDLVIAEAFDTVGPLIAAAYGVPLATHAIGSQAAPAFLDAIAAVAASRYTDRGLTPIAASWYVDPCPDVMQGSGADIPNRLRMRPAPHEGPGAPARTENVEQGVTNGRPQVLVTFGTHFSDPQVLTPVLSALADLDIDLRVTLGFTATSADFALERDNVTFVGFTPLADLLDGTDLVVNHGGAGTVLGALARGLPLVVLPQGADQFFQAAAVSKSRLGISLLPDAATPEGIAAAVTEVLADPEYRENALKSAAQIATMPTAAEIAAHLAAAIG